MYGLFVLGFILCWLIGCLHLRCVGWFVVFCLGLFICWSFVLYVFDLVDCLGWVDLWVVVWLTEGVGCFGVWVGFVGCLVVNCSFTWFFIT